MLLQVGDQRVHAVDGDAVKLGPDQFGLDIEGAVQPEAPFTEAEIIHQGSADVAHADQYRTEAPVNAQNGGNLRPEGGHIITVALLAKFAKAAEILADLRGGKPQLLAQLKRGNAADAVIGKLIQLAQISGQPANHIVGYF